MSKVTVFSIATALLGLLIGSSEGFSTTVPAANKNNAAVPFFRSNDYWSPTALFSIPPENIGEDDDDDDEDEAAKLKRKAAEMREQIRSLEEKLGGERKRNYDIPEPTPAQAAATLAAQEELQGKSLRRKRVLVVGANGRLGAMVCRYLLRNHPDTEVVAAVHYVGEESYTSRGYGRLSYEVGAEDGAGSIGAAWSAEDRVATFEYTDEMKDYNLRNLRLVEVELLDPVQCDTICEGVDSVLWCATDFNGNSPRAISGLNVAFLFRAITDSTKGRVEIEGLQNILGSLKKNLQDRKWRGTSGGMVGEQQQQARLSGPNDPTNFVLVSPAPGIFGNSETPFGEFNAMKRQGEQMLAKDFPSLSHAILQLGLFDDNFVEEGLDILREEHDSADSSIEDEGNSGIDENSYRLRINRRDAARAVVDALTDQELENKTTKIWTALRG